MRAFAYFSHEGKVGRGMGLEAPSDFGKKHVSFPRPAAHESEPIGALRWHNAHLNEERSPVRKIKKLYLGENKSKFLLKTPACVVY